MLNQWCAALNRSFPFSEGRQSFLLVLVVLLAGCNITVINEGGGTVTSGSGLIDCGTQCTASYAVTATEVLTAIPDDGFAFAGWTGACTGLDECSIAIGQYSGNKTVTAVFVPVYRLQVSPVFQGRIYSNDTKIDCGTTCDANYIEPAVITLTAVPNDGYEFVRWEGQCLNQDICEVALDQTNPSATVSAVFREVRAISDLATDSHYNCVVKNGAVYCFGRKYYGPQPPADLVNVSKVVMAYGFGCAIADEQLACWGNANELPVIPNTLQSPRELAAGNRVLCVIHADGLSCFGDNVSGQINVPALTNVTRVVVGFQYACAIADEGLVCWGSRNPVGTAVFEKPSDISARGSRLCVIDNGRVRCFGLNYAVPEMTHPTKIAVGFDHACAIAREGVRCWGSNSYGQLNPPADLNDPSLLSVGVSHSCAVDANGLRCWGSNDDGQLTSSSQIIAPRKIVMQDSYAQDGVCALTDSGVKCVGVSAPSANNIVDLELGSLHDCVLTANAGAEPRLGCSGESAAGQLGLTMPTASMLALGSYFSCAISTVYGTQCAGSAAGSLTPPSLSNPYQIEAGHDTVCALHDGGVACWGYRFAATPGVTNATDISIGGISAICAVADGRIRCTGFDELATSVPALTNVSDISLASEHGCALTGGKVVCWGEGRFGQTDPPPGLANVTSIEVSTQTSCALNPEGLTCWGQYNLSPVIVP